MKSFFRVLLIGATLGVTMLLGVAGALATPVAATTGVNVRSGPGNTFRVIDTLRRGEFAEVVECVSSGWCRVEHAGPTGWVYSRYLGPRPGAGNGNGNGGQNGGQSSNPAQPNASQAMACFYTGQGFRGEKTCSGVGTFNNLGTFDNRIRSYQVFGGARVEFCVGPNMTGSCFTGSRSTPTLGGPLDRQASSLRLFTLGQPNPAPSNPGPSNPSPSNPGGNSGGSKGNDCSFGLVIGPNGPTFSLTCGNNPIIPGQGNNQGQNGGQNNGQGNNQGNANPGNGGQNGGQNGSSGTGLFGDDSSPFAVNGQCNDPRFTGPGTAQPLNASNIRRDGTDCADLFYRGKVQFKDPSQGPQPPAGSLVRYNIIFGDDSGSFANDQGCDDPRFEGPGTAIMGPEFMYHDASDCLAQYENGTAFLKAPGNAIPPPIVANPGGQQSGPGNNGQGNPNPGNGGIGVLLDFGDDSGTFPVDGECDDPRFTGPGMADATTLRQSNVMRDATDCEKLFNQGQVWLPNQGNGAPQPPSGFQDFGDDNGTFPMDGECDDPRFSGPGMADPATLRQSNVMHDATDCRDLFQQGKISF